ncbi:MAG: lasso peptide biosynthesis B2 protein [Acidobacteria bacterium]|nr:lasso peptide biosynthesis B2 protein [Acidobacteriota bacterium]
MQWLVVRAYLRLVHFDRLLAKDDFAALYQEVRLCPLSATPGPDAVERVCGAVDMACIWYWKEVLCLQRSAVVACLLRQCGVPAKMNIGCQVLPFRAHAWVEVHGQVVNDKPYVREIYAVIDRC